MTRKTFGAFAAPLFMTVMVSVTASTAAFASTDVKTYPATMCVERTPNPPAGVTPVLALKVENGRITNKSETSILIVDCPIVQDNVGPSTQSGSPDGLQTGGIRSAMVKVIDANPTFGNSVICSLFSRRSDGSLVGFANANTGAQPDVLNGKPTSLFFEKRLSSGFSNQVDPGYYHMVCQIPPMVTDSAGKKQASGLLMYQVTEEIEQFVADTGLDTEK